VGILMLYLQQAVTGFWKNEKFKIENADCSLQKQHCILVPA
jgi:hypothetical protein